MTTLTSLEDEKARKPNNTLNNHKLYDVILRLFVRDTQKPNYYPLLVLPVDK